MLYSIQRIYKGLERVDATMCQYKGLTEYEGKIDRINRENLK